MARELTEAEYAALDAYTIKAGIAYIDRGSTQIFFDGSLGALGKYKVVGNDIFLPDLPLMIKELTPTVIHELTHQKQRRVLGFADYHMLKLFSNELEEEANRNQWRAEERLEVGYFMKQDHPDQNRKWYHRFMFWEK